MSSPLLYLYCTNLKTDVGSGVVGIKSDVFGFDVVTSHVRSADEAILT